MLIKDTRFLGQRQRTFTRDIGSNLSFSPFVSIPLAPPKCHRDDMKGSDECCALGGLTHSWGTCCFVGSSKQTCSLSWRESLLHYSQLLTVNITLRNDPGKKRSGLCILVIPRKMGRSMKDP